MRSGPLIRDEALPESIYYYRPNKRAGFPVIVRVSPGRDSHPSIGPLLHTILTELRDQLLRLACYALS